MLRPDGNKIRCLRKTQKLTQQDIAELVSVRRETISRAENGDPAAIGIETVQAIAKALHVEWRSLCYEETAESLVNPRAASMVERDLLRRYRLANSGNKIAIYACAFGRTTPVTTRFWDEVRLAEIRFQGVEDLDVFSVVRLSASDTGTPLKDLPLIAEPPASPAEGQPDQTAAEKADAEHEGLRQEKRGRRGRPKTG